MINMSGKYLKLLLFLLIVPIVYGCGSFNPYSMLPKDDRYIKPMKPEIVIPDSVLSELNKFKLRSWRYIVIHHSASDSGNAATIGKYHKNVKGWVNGLGYHFLIGNGNGSKEGQIEVGDRWMEQIDGAHAGNDKYNRYGIGICLVGNFEDRYPSKKQISSLVYLVDYLQNRCNIPKENVVLHKSVRKTVCPGRYFPYNEVFASLR